MRISLFSGSLLSLRLLLDRFMCLLKLRSLGFDDAEETERSPAKPILRVVSVDRLERFLLCLCVACCAQIETAILSNFKALQ